VTTDRPERPLTPGSVWRSRGTSGHDHYQVRITKLTAAGRVTFMRVTHRQGRGERRTTLNEPAFRGNYEPVKVEPIGEAQQTAHQLDALRYQQRRRQVAATVTNGALVDRLRLDPEDLVVPDPPVPIVVETEPEPVPIRPDLVEPEAFSGGAPPAPTPEPPAAVPVLDAYLDAGLRFLEALDAQLREQDEAIARLLAEKDLLVAQRAAIAASLETLSQQAPAGPKEARP
jgi:hypothetical protein